jgi:hypothetical protein
MIQGNFVAMLIFSVIRGYGSFNFTRCPCFAARTPSFMVSGAAADAKDAMAIIADDDATHEGLFCFIFFLERIYQL